MDRDHALTLLGLPADASAREVELAYKTRSRALKLQVLGAPRSDVKDRNLEALRRLVHARDAALGRNGDRGGRRLVGISGRRLVQMMRETKAALLDREQARAFFELPADAPNEEVLEAYRVRSRALVQRFALAHDDEEMANIRRARSKLRTIRNFALASA